TRELVKLIDEYNVVLLDTRKTTPGLRIFEKKAICDGGAKPHRFNLNEMILIKDNHKTIAGGIKNAIELVRKDLQAGIRIEVEVENVSELKEAINCNPDIIMFDNWSVDNLKEGVKLVPNHIFTEASGMINKSNIKGYAKTGIKSISTSYMIKERKWVDFSLEAV
ncbi:MAG: nicotinate-nucleotide diphosphorylase (carboxylating), partial [Candidatus Melainabacteria bacterium]|nr:nicotinate-nucleotide diphosphorylase (carboxylating) [Candidatus Melainabacteria bacterium]